MDSYEYVMHGKVVKSSFIYYTHREEEREKERGERGDEGRSQ